MDQTIQTYLTHARSLLPPPTWHMLSEERHVHVVADALPNHPEESEIVGAARFEVLIAILGMQSFSECERELSALSLSENERAHLVETVRAEIFDPLNAAADSTGRDTSPENVRFLAPITADTGMMARYEKLPGNVRSIICSEGLAHAFDTLATTYALTEHQAATLARQAALVMVGIATTKEFLAGTMHELGLSQERFDDLARAIDTQVFTPVRQAIIAALERRDTTTSAAPAA